MRSLQHGSATVCDQQTGYNSFLPLNSNGQEKYPISDKSYTCAQTDILHGGQTNALPELGQTNALPELRKPTHYQRYNAQPELGQTTALPELGQRNENRKPRSARFEAPPHGNNVR